MPIFQTFVLSICRSVPARSLAICVVTVTGSGCAGLYVPVVGLGRDSNGEWVFLVGGGGGAVGAGGIGASCASSCFGDPNGETCTAFRATTKETCGIKEAAR